MQERRKQERRKDANAVDLKPYNDYMKVFIKRSSFALTEDISMGGVKIITDTFLPLDSVIGLEINMVRSRTRMTLPGKVGISGTQARAVNNHVYFLGPFDLIDFGNRLSAPGRRFPMDIFITVPGKVLSELLKFFAFANLPLGVNPNAPV